MNRLLTEETISSLKALLSVARRAVVTCHVNPDGDAIGSVAATVQLLRRIGVEAVGIVPNAFPEYLRSVPLSGELVVCNTDRERAKELVSGADVVFCLDYNRQDRAGALLAGMICDSEARRVMIDHHLCPDDFCDIAISAPELTSTCEVLLRVMNDIGWLGDMTRDEAECVYVGMMTDTGAFTYASSRPEVYECISLLLQKGIDKDKLYRNIYQTCSEGKLRLTGYILYVKMEVMKDKHAALITLTNEEYRRFGLRNGDTEGLVNLPLQIDGVVLSVFLRQDMEEKGRIRVSTRSVGDFPCNEMAEEFFNGGGHRNAAGGSMLCSMEEAVERVRHAVNKYEPLLNKQQ